MNVWLWAAAVLTVPLAGLALAAVVRRRTRDQAVLVTKENG